MPLMGLLPGSQSTLKGRCRLNILAPDHVHFAGWGGSSLLPQDAASWEAPAVKSKKEFIPSTQRNLPSTL